VGVKTRTVDVWDFILKEHDIDLSKRPASPCNECLVAAMCKKLCPDITDYLFDYETYDRALEKTLLQCWNNSAGMDMFELRSHRRGIYKRWLVRAYRGRIQSFIDKKAKPWLDPEGNENDEPSTS